MDLLGITQKSITALEQFNMTLTKTQQQRLRQKVLSDVESDGICEIDHRFQDVIFGPHEEMVNWCSKWGLGYRYVTYANINRSIPKAQPIEWLQIYHLDDHRDEFLIFPDNRFDERKVLIISEDHEL